MDDNRGCPRCDNGIVGAETDVAVLDDTGRLFCMKCELEWVDPTRSEKMSTNKGIGTILDTWNETTIKEIEAIGPSYYESKSIVELLPGLKTTAESLGDCPAGWELTRTIDLIEKKIIPLTEGLLHDINNIITNEEL